MNDFDPPYATALAALQAGKPAEAAIAARRALQAQPAASAAHHLLGVAELQLGHADVAVDHLQLATHGQPDNAEFRLHLGQALGVAGQFEAARDALQTAAGLAPDAPAILHALGLAWQRLGNPQRAVEYLRPAVAKLPQDAAAATNLAHVLLDLGEWEQAVAFYQQALQHNPGHAAALTGWSDALLRQNRPCEALAMAERALALAPHRWECHYNLGNAHKALCGYSAAIAAYETALALAGDQRKIEWNLAMALLAQGEWQRGWALFESRRDQPWVKPRHFDCPPWQGEPLAGRRLLVVAEQGMGDSLQFLRLIPRLAAQGIQVVLQLQAGLRGLAPHLPEVAEWCTLDQPPPVTDRWAWMLSLPRLLEITAPDQLPQHAPYLPRAAATPLPGIQIGLSWQGNRAYPGDHLRSPGIQPLRALRWPSTAQLHCLQRDGLTDFRQIDGPRADRPWEIDSHGPPFAETRQLLSQLDLVITSDTAIAHLAGALAVPTWLMLPFTPDYRWGMGQGGSVWYPTLRMFRQTAPGDWSSVVAAMQEALDRLLGSAT